MSSGLRIILISNLVTILVTALAVIIALHLNPSLVGDEPVDTRALQGDDANAGDCCDCETGEFIPPPPMFACFSSATKAELENGDTVPMKDLRIGDRVMVSNGKYEPIYTFGHFDESVNNADFIQIRTSTSSGLEMTPDHLIFKEGNEVVPASNLVLGDKLMMGSGLTEEVVSIKKTKRLGIFAPFTPSGMIVTNGVQSSCFATVQGGNSKVSLGGGMELPLTYHRLGLVFESPHRLLCQLSSCSDKYNEDGMSQWVEMPLHGLEWILQQNVLIGGLVLLMLLVSWSFFNVLELIAMNHLISSAMSVMIMMTMIPSFRRIVKKCFAIGDNKATKVA
mmetsp:Transcript_16717/g.25255  ORF Transcript_16717/g.25255 Transcript_16717/m.25255 type:complete len:336 (+) Transcript_16717:83-1090(+)